MTPNHQTIVTSFGKLTINKVTRFSMAWMQCGTGHPFMTFRAIALASDAEQVCAIQHIGLAQNLQRVIGVKCPKCFQS
jgi:hypothetical protein